jgi:hypothetical protein
MSPWQHVLVGETSEKQDVHTWVQVRINWTEWTDWGVERAGGWYYVKVEPGLKRPVAVGQIESVEDD